MSTLFLSPQNPGADFSPGSWDREKSAPPLISSRQGYGLMLILPFPQKRPFSFKEITVALGKITQKSILFALCLLIIILLWLSQGRAMH